MLGPEFDDALLDAGSDLRVTGAAAPRHREGDDGFAVELGKGSRLFDGIGDGGEVVEANLVSAGDDDGSRLQVGETDRAAARVRIDCSRPPTSPRPPAMSAEVMRS